MAAGKSQSLWTPTFALLCCAQFFGSAQHALLQPTFPLYITSLGGTPFKVGLVIACFAVTSVVFRPLIGGWADKWSETRVLICGLLLLSAAVFFCFIPFAETTMFANALRGLGWAGLSAAGYSLLALSAPAERRGEASGYYSGIQASGTILLPAVALWLIDAPFGGFRTVFVVAIGWPPSARAPVRSSRATHRNRLTTGMRLLCSVVAGNFKRFGPGNDPGIRAFIWFPCHFPGSGEFFGSLREGNRHRKHRLVLCRLRGDEPPRSPDVRKGIRPDGPAARLARVLYVSSCRSDGAGLRFQPHRLDYSRHALHGGPSDGQRNHPRDRNGTGQTGAKRQSHGDIFRCSSSQQRRRRVDLRQFGRVVWIFLDVPRSCLHRGWWSHGNHREPCALKIKKPFKTFKQFKSFKSVENPSSRSFLLEGRS